MQTQSCSSAVSTHLRQIGKYLFQKTFEQSPHRFGGRLLFRTVFLFLPVIKKGPLDDVFWRTICPSVFLLQMKTFVFANYTCSRSYVFARVCVLWILIFLICVTESHLHSYMYFSFFSRSARDTLGGRIWLLDSECKVYASNKVKKLGYTRPSNPAASYPNTLAQEKKTHATTGT